VVQLAREGHVGELHGSGVEQGEHRLVRPSLDTPAAGVHRQVVVRVRVHPPRRLDLFGHQRVGLPLASA
jgi:hypothetical protein